MAETKIEKVSKETPTLKVLLKKDGLVFKQDQTNGEIRVYGEEQNDLRCFISKETLRELVLKEEFR